MGVLPSRAACSKSIHISKHVLVEIKGCLRTHCGNGIVAEYGRFRGWLGHFYGEVMVSVMLQYGIFTEEIWSTCMVCCGSFIVGDMEFLLGEVWPYIAFLWTGY